MRTLALASLTLLSSAAFAERLILIPTGNKLLKDVLSYEVLTESSRDNTMGWLGTGLGHSFDLEVTGESFNNNRMVNSLDFAYNYTVPVTDFIPGISFGVQDALNVTERGRDLYMAVTYSFGNSGELNQDIPTEFTFGLWTRSEGAFFAGVVLPWSKYVSLVAEHDGDEMTGGVDLSPFMGGTFRFLFRQNQVMVGFRVQARF